MTQYNGVNVKLPDPQLELKSATKDETGVTLRLSSNKTGNFYDDTFNFLHKLSFINRQVTNLLKAFANNSVSNGANVKLLNSQISKIIQSGRFLGELLGLLLLKSVHL